VNNLLLFRLILAFSHSKAFIGEKRVCHGTTYKKRIGNRYELLNDTYLIAYFCTSHHRDKRMLRRLHNIRNCRIFTFEKKPSDTWKKVCNRRCTSVRPVDNAKTILHKIPC